MDMIIEETDIWTKKFDPLAPSTIISQLHSTIIEDSSRIIHFGLYEKTKELV
jgi:hypothetical protein